MENRLLGKKIIWNGDSICAGNEHTGCWASRIGDKNSMIYANYAIGGGTIAEGFPEMQSGAPRHSVSKTLEQMYREHPDADYIVLEGGTNDADLFEESDNPSGLGSFDSENFSGNYDVNTFCGALESVFYRALKFWSGKRICFIVAHKMGEPHRGGMILRYAAVGTEPRTASQWLFRPVDSSLSVRHSVPCTGQHARFYSAFVYSVYPLLPKIASAFDTIFQQDFPHPRPVKCIECTAR